MRFIVLLLLFFQFSFAQERFTFSADVAKFKAEKGLTYLEIYTSLPRNQLRYEIEGDRFVGNFEIEVSIIKNDSIYYRNSHKKIDYTQNLSDIKEGQKLLNCLKIFMKDGSYRLNLKITDLISQNKTEFERPLIINFSDYNSFSLSDIELSSSIQKASNENEFYKNGYTILPNPERKYGIELPLLYFYMELYNLPYKENSAPQFYDIIYHIISVDGDTIKTFPAKRRQKPGASSIEVGGINIMGFLAGTYNLVLSVKDNETGTAIDNKKEFYISKPSLIQPARPAPSGLTLEQRIALEEAGLKELDQEKTEELYQKLSYILTNNEKNIYKTLSLAEKKRFIAVFWAKNDPSPETPLNEFKRDFMNKINYSNSQYRERKPGWKTDRGRVFIIYGKPDNTDYFPNSPETVAYQIWYFYRIEQEGTERGVEFVFADFRRNGEYVLVHSTALREVRNYEWRDYIRR